jgi:hypothetical protein
MEGQCAKGFVCRFVLGHAFPYIIAAGRKNMRCVGAVFYGFTLALLELF